MFELKFNTKSGNMLKKKIQISFSFYFRVN